MDAGSSISLQARRLAPGLRAVLEYTLSTEDEVLESTVGGPPLEAVLGTGRIHPGIEKALEGLCEGDSFNKILDPSLAFGEPDDQLIIKIAARKLPPLVSEAPLGSNFEMPGPNKKPRLFRLVARVGEQVTLDGNHPLAGVPLHLEGRLLKVLDP